MVYHYTSLSQDNSMYFTASETTTWSQLGHTLPTTPWTHKCYLTIRSPEKNSGLSLLKYMLHMLLNTTTTQSKLSSYQVQIIPFLFHSTKIRFRNLTTSFVSVRTYSPCDRTANLHVAGYKCHHHFEYHLVRTIHDVTKPNGLNEYLRLSFGG